MVLIAAGWRLEMISVRQRFRSNAAPTAGTIQMTTVARYEMPSRKYPKQLLGAQLVRGISMHSIPACQRPLVAHIHAGRIIVRLRICAHFVLSGPGIHA